MIVEHLKSSENFQGYKPKCIHCQHWSGFPAKRECGWQGRSEASTFQRLSSLWTQNTVRIQSSHGVQEPHAMMPTLRTTLMSISSAREEIVSKKILFSMAQTLNKMYTFLNYKNNHKALD